MCIQLADLDNSYPGGLTSYLKKARKLLKESADGTNPFLDFTASVPVGESLVYDDDEAADQTGMTFSEAEQVGLTGISDVAFVLVAGGLGAFHLVLIFAIVFFLFESTEFMFFLLFPLK